MNERISWIRAIYWIVLSTVLISGSSYLGYFQYRRWIKHRQTDSSYAIRYIVGDSLSEDSLSAQQIAELLDLSFDNPINLFVLDEKKAEEKMKSYAWIEDVNLLKIKPNALKVTYKMRKPAALLSEYENMAVDSGGHIFPFRPYYLGKDPLELILGLPEEEISLSAPISHPGFELAMNILDFLQVQSAQSFKIEKIDVSNAFADSLGKREIIVALEDDCILLNHHCFFPKILRLHTIEYGKQLSNFFALNKKMRKDYLKQIQHLTINNDRKFTPQVIDMRIPQLAFIEEN